ncbi:LuxR C-terminal-related transcriptional regulator [Microbacterium sp.]|uniref:helix-turn-helix transcriptional regulator n=1 Tax=Microbacterium sp. TaxID=51671 RepID=UPI003F9626CB
MTDSPARIRRERAAEMAARAVEHSGMLLLVSGAPGMGKTHLLRDLGARLSESKRVHYVAADEFEQTIPYAFAERLLSSGITEDSTIAASAQTLEVARRLIDGLVGAPRGEVRTLLIDDAQWIDHDSAKVLRFVIPRVARRGVFLTVATRSIGERETLGGYLQEYAGASTVHQHVRLEPLTADDIRALALERFGAGISQRTARMLREASGGSFLGIEALFTGVTQSEIRDLHLTWNLPIRRASLPESPFLAGFATLSPAGRLAVEVASVASHEISPRVLTLVGEELGEPIDADEAIAAGALTESGFGTTVATAHALVASAVRDVMSAERARRVNRALAEVTDGYASITHALRGSNEWSPDLERRVDEYVRSTLAQGHLDATYEILRASIAIATGAARERLITDLGLLNLRHKTGFAVLDLFDDIAALPPSAVRDCLVIVLLMYRFEQEAAQAKLQELLMRPAEDPETATVQAFLGFIAMIMVMRSPDPAIPTELAALCRGLWANAPEDPSALSDQRLAWMVGPRAYEAVMDGYGIVALHLDYRNSEVEQVLPTLVERAFALPDTDLKIDALVPLAGAAVAIGDVRLAHTIAETGVGILEKVTTPPWASGSIRFMRAHTLMLLGRVPEAATITDLARELSYDFIDVETRMTFAALHAWIQVVMGRDGGAAPLEEARRLGELGWEVYASDIVTVVECEAARAAGDAHGVLSATSEDRVSRYRNTQRGFLTYRAHALIDLGRTDEAAELVDRLAEQRGTTWQETTGTLAWLQARLAEARSDADVADRLYREAAEQSEELSPLVLALTLADLGEFRHAQGDHAAAEDALRRAVGLLEAIEAHAYLPSASDRLMRVTDRDRRERERLIEALTAREREVARHLIEGSSNAQIAETLFISQATARFHVSNVLRKLGLARRAEVASVLSDGL